MYEERFGKNNSGICKFSIAELKEIAAKNISSEHAYVSSGFDWCGMIIDALEIGFLMGYRKAERRIRIEKGREGV